LAVHHSRKATAEDFVETVSGTNGLAGAADHILVLKHPRLAMHGSLLVTGRDVPEGEYGLISDQGHGWRLDGDTLVAAAASAEARQQRERLGDRSLEVVSFVNGRCETRAADLNALGIDQEQARVYLNRLADAGHIAKVGRGLYRGVTTVTSVTAPRVGRRERNRHNGHNTPL
jgi:Transcriptional regulator, AbiEi antitoxin